MVRSQLSRHGGPSLQLSAFSLAAVWVPQPSLPSAYCLLSTAFGARSLLGISSRQGVKHKVGKGPNECRRTIQAHRDMKMLHAETLG